MEDKPDLEMNVRMTDGRQKRHGRRRVRVVGWDLHANLPLAALVRCAVDALEDRGPLREVVVGDGAEGDETRVRILAVFGEFFDEALANGGDRGSHCVVGVCRKCMMGREGIWGVYGGYMEGIWKV